MIDPKKPQQFPAKAAAGLKAFGPRLTVRPDAGRTTITAAMTVDGTDFRQELLTIPVVVAESDPEFWADVLAALKAHATRKVRPLVAELGGDPAALQILEMRPDPVPPSPN